MMTLFLADEIVALVFSNGVHPDEQDRLITAYLIFLHRFRTHTVAIR